MSAFGGKADIARPVDRPLFEHWCRLLRFRAWASGASMRRRDFVTFVGSLVAWPLTVRAQQPATPVTGFLRAASPETVRDLVDACHRGLADTGFAEGGDLTIEYRWAEENNARLPALAMDLARR